MAAGLGDGAVDVVAGKRPADQLAAVDAPDSEGTRDGRLGLARIRRDDFQVGPGAEREQSVMRANTNMLAARPGLNTELAFQFGHRRTQIGSGINEVVNQHVNLSSRKCGCRTAAKYSNVP